MLFSLVNITCEKVERVKHEVLKNGLLYFALNDEDEKVNQPFKASLLGRDAGLKVLNDHFLKSKQMLNSCSNNETLKVAVILIMKTIPTEIEFKNKLKEMEISTGVRCNAARRIYGIISLSRF